MSEIGETLGWRVLDARYAASCLAVGVITFFAFYEIGERPAVLAIWLIVEAVRALARSHGRKLAPSMQVAFED